MEQNLEFSLLSAYILLSFFLFLLIIKISPKIFNGKLLDNDFQKPLKLSGLGGRGLQGEAGRRRLGGRGNPCVSPLG